MKTIYIIRHAKSSWKDTSASDFDRPLNKRGKADAPFMGKLLKEKNINPDVIISSPALRAKKTAKAIAKEVGFSHSIVYEEELYASGASILLRTIKKLKNKENTAFLISHNPGINMLVDRLVGYTENVPTCGILKIDFYCDKWGEISAKNADLAFIEYPKKYKKNTL